MEIKIAEKMFAELAENDCYKAKDLFNQNYRKIRQTVVDYQYLRYIYNKHEYPFVKDEYFIGLFRRFYAMRFVQPHFVTSFFTKMEEIRNGNNNVDYDAVDVTWEVCGQDTKQFSFITKMLNLYDDTRYPIYDNMVGRVCLLFYNIYDTEDLRKKQFEYWYKRIKEVYITLFDKEHIEDSTKIIHIFRDVFRCPAKEDLTDQRIVDIILWQLGESLGKLWPLERISEENPKNIKLLKEEGITVEKLIKRGVSRTDIIDSGRFTKEDVFETALKYGREQKEKANQNK